MSWPIFGKSIFGGFCLSLHEEVLIVPFCVWEEVMLLLRHIHLQLFNDTQEKGSRFLAIWTDVCKISLTWVMPEVLAILPLELEMSSSTSTSLLWPIILRNMASIWIDRLAISIPQYKTLHNNGILWNDSVDMLFSIWHFSILNPLIWLDLVFMTWYFFPHFLVSLTYWSPEGRI